MHIAAWLQDLGLERYKEAFRENEIDWEVLPDLTESDLEKIGLPLGIRKKVLKAIRAIGDGQATDEAKFSQAPAVHPAAERRQVTVLFADLAGYTRLSRTVDAEEVHALLSRFFGLVDGIVKQYGGTIDKHIGDCVMAVFGAPLAHSNDPERAVRAALEIQSSMLSLGDHIGGPVGVHIGVASGQVVASSTGSGDHLEYTVTGDSVNLASRLTDAAKSGETLISDPIQQALRDRLECEEVETLVVKGFTSPVRAWRLHGWRAAAGAHRRLFVGRRAELQQFEAALAACRETGCGQAIYIRGEAGIGKTHLIEELQNLAEAAGFACHIGLVLDFGAGTGRDAIRVLFRGILGLALDADEADARTAAERALEEELVEPEQRVFLNDLLDLPQAPALRARYDTMDNASRNRGKSKTVVGLVERAAQRCPLMLVVEDLHWAEPLTLQHLARLTEAVTNCPALLVMTSRLEGDPLDQTWRSETGGSPLTTVDLGPLRRQEAELLADAYIDHGQDFATRCVERAAGNPLFLEQLLRYAEENVPAGIPGSVQSLVQARMDRLPPPDKTALQAAAVFGQRFSLDALRFLIERPEYIGAEPVAHFLVRRRADSFLFAHSLIRDAVYDSLLKARRRQLHRRAADWFAERDAVLHAEHLDRAEAPEAPRAYLDAARSQAGEHHYFIAWLPADGAREILAEGPTTLAGALFPPQPATRVEGGWRVTGQVPYASGCANATWWALPAVEMDGDKPRVDPQTGQPAPFGVFFRREEGRILDTWHTVGMRGTGSANIAVDNLFIPDRRTMPVKPLGTPAPGFEGPLYRMVPWLSILGEATVSVGIAAAAVDALIEVARTKTPAYTTTPLREQQFAQLVAARAKARVDASRDTLYRAAEEAYRDVQDGSLLSWNAKIRLQLAVCFAAEACAEAVRLVCDGAGASSIRTEQPFERYLRDVQVLTQHSSKSGPRYVSAGRLMFGLENDWVWLSF